MQCYSLTCLLEGIKSYQPKSCQAKQEHNVDEKICKEELVTKTVPLVLQETCHQRVKEKFGVTRLTLEYKE